MTQSTNHPNTIAIRGRQTILTGWGRTAPTKARLLFPQTQQQIETILSSTPARGVIPRGLGRSYGDPAQNAGGTVIDMTGFDRVLAFDPTAGTVQVEAGISLDRLMQLLVPAGFFVPVTPGTRYVTAGGAIAADIHGKNHHVDGSFSNHVERLELITPAGDHRILKPSDNLFAATAGGMGLTGLIWSATIRLIPIQTAFIKVDTERASNLDDLMARMVEGDEAYRYSVAWVDTMARGNSLGRSVLYRGDHASVDDLGDQDPNQLRIFKSMPAPTMPEGIPGGLINSATVRAFNEFWYRRHPVEARGQIQTLTGFFHQLDLVNQSNRMYGPGGFVQHQCVVPLNEAKTIRTIIDKLSDERCPSFLVVLKRMGPGNGLLSFPIEGWTLAVDIPSRWDGLADLLDEIDELVLQAGGRLYLAKDARMRPEALPAMYPELNAWRSIVARADPNRRFRSDLDRRLALRDEGV